MMAGSEDAELCFPRLLNSSCRRTVRPPSVSLLTNVALSSVSLLTVVLNLLVIISITHFKRLHSPTNLLLLSLAVSDFLVGFIVLAQIWLLGGCWLLGDLLCALYVLLEYTVTSASVGNMVLISVDRYLAVCDPLRYPSRVTLLRAKAVVCQCWLCSVLCDGLLLLENLARPGSFKSCVGDCVVVVDDVAGIVHLLLSFVGPVAAILLLYGRVLAVAVSQARALRAHAPAPAAQRKSELKAARTLGVVVVVFLLCLCPFYCVTLSAQGDLFSASSIAFVLNLLYLNSCLNPLIYALLYPWFRRSVRLIVTLQILRPGSRQADILRTD